MDHLIHCQQQTFKRQSRRPSSVPCLSPISPVPALPIPPFSTPVYNGMVSMSALACLPHIHIAAFTLASSSSPLSLQHLLHLSPCLICPFPPSLEASVIIPGHSVVCVLLQKFSLVLCGWFRDPFSEPALTEEACLGLSPLLLFVCLLVYPNLSEPVSLKVKWNVNTCLTSRV